MQTLPGSPLPIYTLKAIEIAIQGGNLHNLKNCFRTNQSDVIGFMDEKGNSALELAICLNQTEIARFLIENNPSFNIHRGLELAVLNKHKEVTELLLNHEQKTLEVSLPDNVVFRFEEDNEKKTVIGIPNVEPCINKPFPKREGESLLHLAIRSNEESIVDLLLKRGSDVNYKSLGNLTPLHIAANNLNVMLVKLLLKQPNIRIISRNKDNLTPLEIAFKSAQDATLEKSKENLLGLEEDTITNSNFQETQKNAREIIDLLIKKSSKDDLEYFLYRAVRDNFPDIVELLLETTQVDINKPYKNNWRVLHIAVAHKYTKIVEILLNKKADFILLNDKKDSPFGLALKAYSTDIIQLFDKKLPLYKERAGFTQNFIKELNHNFFSALQLGDKTIIEALLSRYNNHITVDTRADSSHYNWPPLHFASFYGHSELVKFFLQKGANPMDEDSMGRTPLHLAIECQKSVDIKNSIIELLLEKEPALLDKPHDDNKTALTLALRQQEPEVVALLLKHRPKLGLGDTLRWAASINSGQRKSTVEIIENLLKAFQFSRNELTNTLHLILLNSKIEQKNLLSIVKLLLEKGAELNTPHEKTKKTPLMISVQQNKEALVDLFLAQKNIQANAIDKDSFSALNHAASKENLNILEKLLEYYQDHNYLYNQTNHPLLSAITAGQKSAVKLLLQYFKDPKAKQLGSAFAWAAEYGHLDIIESIVEYGFDINTQIYFKRKGQVSALSIAAEKGQTKVVEFLLHQQASPSLPDRHGWIPLHLAIKAGHQETALALINLGPEIHLQAGPEEDAPLHLAAEYGLYKVVDELINKHVNIDIKNFRGETPLHFAIANGFESIALLLIEKGADIYSTIDGSMVDTNGALIECEDFSALHLAAQSGSAKIAARLLAAGINPNIKTINKITPLHSAAQSAHERNYPVLPILDLLIAAGARIDSETFEGQTPLHLSAEFGDLEMTKRLVEEYDKLIGKGENIKDIINTSIHSNNKLGLTPIHIAIYHRHLALVKYFLEHGIDMAKNHQGLIALELAVKREVEPQKSSAIYFPETPLSPKKYPPFFYSSNQAPKEDSIEIAILKPLLAKYLTHFTLSSEEKANLLSAATKHKQTNIVSFLLNQEDFSPNDQNSNGEYPMQISAMVGSIEIMELLLAKGAKINLKKSKTPLSYAADYNQTEAIEWLLSHSADLTIIDAEYSRNPIHFAVIGDAKESLKTLLDHAKSKNIAKKLIDSQDSLALTPLHLAIIYEQDNEIIKMLVDHGANLNKVAYLPTKASSESNWTPMNFALYSENASIAKLLFGIRALPDENTVDPKQWTTFIKILIDSGNVLKQKDTSSAVTHFIASQYIKCIFDILNNSQVEKELNNVTFKSTAKMLAAISRSAADYMEGRPIDSVDDHLETPDLSLRMLKTPGSSAVDPRTGSLVSPPRQQAQAEQDGYFVSSASRHYARLR